MKYVNGNWKGSVFPTTKEFEHFPKIPPISP